MDTYAHLGLAVAQLAVLTALAPLVTGVIQKLKARWQCRRGASVWQPYRDLAKLQRKGSVISDSASGFFRAVPPLVLAATLAAAALVPVLFADAAAGPLALPLGDAIVLLGLLSLARELTDAAVEGALWLPNREAFAVLPALDRLPRSIRRDMK